MSWTYSQTSGRDLADPGWASAPTACRDQSIGGQLYPGLGGTELDALAGTGTVTSASGWTTTILEACRDGS